MKWSKAICDRLSKTHAATHPVRPPSLAWFFPLNAIIWTLATWLLNNNLDRQGDMLENYVLGSAWQAGYSKHPPFFAWITAAWFWLFPHVDLAYFALSACNVMVGLFGIVALARRFLPQPLAVIAGLAMAVSPLYSTLAMKFNANAMLLSVWPWTAYFFVLFMQTRGRRQAVALGSLAALAMLSKYFSIVLLAALCLVAIVHPPWRRTLRQSPIWLVFLSGAILLTPHLYWLVANDFPSFKYMEARTTGTLLAALTRFGVYTLAQIMYLLPSFILLLLLLRTQRGKAARHCIASMVRPTLAPDLWWLTFAPFIMVGLTAILAKVQMASVWGMAEWFALAPLWLVALSHAGIPLAPAQEKQIFFTRCRRIFLGYWLIVLVVSTTLGYLSTLRHTQDATVPRAELALAAQTLWRQRTGQDIPIVTGSHHEAQAIAFYSAGHTRYWDSYPTTTPWLTAADLKRQGAMYVCRDDDAACLTTGSAFTGMAAIPITVHKVAWGKTLPAYTYQLFLLQPER